MRRLFLAIAAAPLACSAPADVGVAAVDAQVSEITIADARGERECALDYPRVRYVRATRSMAWPACSPAVVDPAASVTVRPDVERQLEQAEAQAVEAALAKIRYAASAPACATGVAEGLTLSTVTTTGAARTFGTEACGAQPLATHVAAAFAELARLR